MNHSNNMTQGTNTLKSVMVALSLLLPTTKALSQQMYDVLTNQDASITVKLVNRSPVANQFLNENTSQTSAVVYIFKNGQWHQSNNTSSAIPPTGKSVTINNVVYSQNGTNVASTYQGTQFESGGGLPLAGNYPFVVENYSGDRSTQPTNDGVVDVIGSDVKISSVLINSLAIGDKVAANSRTTNLTPSGASGPGGNWLILEKTATGFTVVDATGYQYQTLAVMDFNATNNSEYKLSNNPVESGGVVAIQGITDQSKPYDYSIIDMTGKTVGSSHHHKGTLIAPLSEGIYLLRIQTQDNEIISKKIIVK